MNSSPDQFDPSKYISKTFLDRMESLENKGVLVAMVRQLLTIALKNAPNQVLVYFAEKIDGTFQARVMASNESVADEMHLDCQYTELIKCGFNTEPILDSTNSNKTDEQVDKIGETLKDFLEGTIRRALIQYIKKENGDYSVINIEERGVSKQNLN